jgi:hypothetical protein
MLAESSNKFEFFDSILSLKFSIKIYDGKGMLETAYVQYYKKLQYARNVDFNI